MMSDGEYRILAGGISHWVRIAGSGRSKSPVVVVHGGPGSSAYALEPIGDRLAEQTCVVFYDQRGCGRSERPASPETYTFAQLVRDLDELREALGCEQIIPWGHSFGAVLAAEYAVAHPGRVGRLILVGPPIVGPLHPGPLALQLAAMDAHASMGTRAALRAALDDVHDPMERILTSFRVLGADSETRQRFTYRGPRPSAEQNGRPKPTAPVNQDMAERLIAAMRTSLIDDLALADPIALVMIGLWDGNVGVDGARDLAVRLPRASLRLFCDSAHAPHEEEPDKYLTAIRNFLSA